MGNTTATLLAMELKKLVNHNERIVDATVDVTSRGLEVRIRVKDYMGYKIAVNSLNRYLQIVLDTFSITGQ